MGRRRVLTPPGCFHRRRRGKTALSEVSAIGWLVIRGRRWGFVVREAPAWESVAPVLLRRGRKTHMCLCLISRFSAPRHLWWDKRSLAFPALVVRWHGTFGSAVDASAEAARVWLHGISLFTTRPKNKESDTVSQPYNRAI